MARTYTYPACPCCNSTMRVKRWRDKVGSRTPDRVVVERDVEFGHHLIRAVGERGPDDARDADWLARVKVAVIRAARALGLASDKRVKQVEREVFPQWFTRKVNEVGRHLYDCLEEHAKRHKRAATRPHGRPVQVRGAHVRDAGARPVHLVVPNYETRVRGLRVRDAGLSRVALLPAPRAPRMSSESRVSSSNVSDGGTVAVAWKP